MIDSLFFRFWSYAVIVAYPVLQSCYKKDGIENFFRSSMGILAPSLRTYLKKKAPITKPCDGAFFI